MTRAIHQTANRNTAGLDTILAELFKAGGDSVLERMHRICLTIWQTGNWPEDQTSLNISRFRRKVMLNSAL